LHYGGNVAKNNINESVQKVILFQKTPPSPVPPLFIEEELVTLPEDREYFNTPSVYRGSTPKGERV